MKKSWNTMLAIFASTALALALLGGCAATTPNETAPDRASEQVPEKAAVGTVLLSVNPEIEVEYDEGGLVLEIEGVNDDGKRVTEAYTGYEGKQCSTVVNELVQEIYKAGYFEQTVDGHTKNIVVKLEDGSVRPNDTFLDDVANGVRDAVQICGVGSKAITVDEDDLDDKGNIGQEKAKELAMAQLGLTDAAFNDHTYELDDGIYELEFSANGVTYDYEVDSRTGKILKADMDGNDDWDGRDGWDDWQDDRLDDSDDDGDDRDDNQDDDQNDDRDDDRDDDDDNQSITIPVTGGNQDDDDDWDDDDDLDDDDTPTPSPAPGGNRDDDDDDWDDDDDQDDDDTPAQSPAPVGNQDDDDDDWDDDDGQDDDDTPAPSPAPGGNRDDDDDDWDDDDGQDDDNDQDDDWDDDDD